MRNRCYNPYYGRFYSEDPVWSTNLFPYADNNPITNIDPNGEYLETAADVASFAYDLNEYKNNPSLGNFVFLALDVVTTALPGVAGGGTVGRASIKGVNYTKSSFKIGQEMHRLYKANDVLKKGIKCIRCKEFRLPSGLRIDFIDFENKIIYELKPNNPRQIKEGKKQLQMYLIEVEKLYGKGWKTVLDLY